VFAHGPFGLDEIR